MLVLLLMESIWGGVEIAMSPKQHAYTYVLWGLSDVLAVMYEQRVSEPILTEE